MWHDIGVEVRGRGRGDWRHAMAVELAVEEDAMRSARLVGDVGGSLVGGVGGSFTVGLSV